MSNRRKPTHLHKIDGTYQPCRHDGFDEIDFQNSTPDAPEILNGVALNEWNRVVPELERLELLTIFDRMILTQYCLLTKELYEVSQSDDPEVKPLTAAWHNQYKLIQQELGFTISSRLSMKMPKKEEKKKSSVFSGGM